MFCKNSVYVHAFSGGLDSVYGTYSVVRRISDVKHALHYIKLYGDGMPIERMFSFLAAKAMEEYINRPLVWSSSEAAFPCFCSPSRDIVPPMTQQINIVTTLARIVAEKNAHQWSAVAFCGWHRGDAIENSEEIGDWSLAEYREMKAMFSRLCYFADCGRTAPLQTPAWDVDKKKMWDTLPEEIRRFVVTTSYDYTYKKDGKVLCVIKDHYKRKQYFQKHGIDLTMMIIFPSEDVYQAVLNATKLSEFKYNLDSIITIPYSEYKIRGEEIINEFRSEDGDRGLDDSDGEVATDKTSASDD